MAWEGVLPADAARDLWLKARATGIGSSDIAYVVGMGKPGRGSLATVWQSKVGEAVPLDMDDLILELGQAAEPVIGARYTKVTGVELRKGSLIRSSERAWQLATPDFFRVTDDHGVECKYINFHASEWGDAGTDEIPDDYIAQTQWQMDALGHAWLHVAAIINSKFRIYTLKRDEELCLALRDEAERFWRDYVLARKRPPMTGAEADDRYLRHAFKQYREALIIQGTEVDLALWKQYLAAVDEAKKRETERDRLEQMLKVRLGELEAEAIDFTSDGRFSWKRCKDTVGPDWEAIAQALRAPDDLISQHTKVTKAGGRRKHVSRKRVSAR